jgi:hypothetical protein
VNDANDIATVLKGLGFTVDIVLNGTLDQMESSITRLKNRLSVSKAAYGFLYYAGHGVQSNGENYLIPVDANIQSETYLRQRAVSVQVMLDELNEAGNELNIVVLDACRDNPFGWSRSGNRGLSIVGRQPADSIIVYATSAGSTASDGNGKNGLFTSHLLNNLKTPNLEVNEMFRLTMGDVARASDGRQRPAIYSQFYETAFLGTKPATNTPVRPAPPPATELYKAGDLGPAGGYIFYDKGYFLDGWRYMEAAPSDASASVSWGILKAYEERTRTDIGSGRENTAYLLQSHTQLRESGKAAHIADGYSANGYTDWFLPSFEELRLMYLNLKTRGLGGFSNNFYWSSTDSRDGRNARSVNFSNGSSLNGDKTQFASVRAIRYF